MDYAEGSPTVARPGDTLPAVDYDDDDELDDLDDEDGLDDGDLTPLEVAAAAVHEVYVALVDAGFTEWEGLRVISWLISEQVPSE